MKKSTIVTASILAVVIGAAGVSAAVITSTPPAPLAASENPQPMTAQDEVQELEQESEIATQASNTDELLLYLIEEEKLAHDVYTVLGQTWGGNTFSNILASESTHQDQVLSLLNTYGLTDPRSAEIGVFANPDLQALYDQLIAQGMTSQTEAYKVGVLIEETDITDLTTAINSTSDANIVAALEKLRSASENHLAAFSKKL
jgi:hypothetical protein